VFCVLSTRSARFPLTLSRGTWTPAFVVCCCAHSGCVLRSNRICARRFVSPYLPLFLSLLPSSPVHRAGEQALGRTRCFVLTEGRREQKAFFPLLSHYFSVLFLLLAVLCGGISVSLLLLILCFEAFWIAFVLDSFSYRKKDCFRKTSRIRCSLDAFIADPHHAANRHQQ